MNPLIQQQVTHGSEILRNGGVMAFPTETVYGLGARYDDPKAIQKIYDLKHRPADNPLIVHINDRNDLSSLVEFPIDSRLQYLMDRFWPGPLTVLLPKSALVPEVVTAGLPTIAIRFPAHEITRDLIDQVGVPLVAPSANPSGKPSATHHDHIAYYFEREVFCIEAGFTSVGLESTVVGIDKGQVTIFRSGGITQENLSCSLEEEVPLFTSREYTPSPGMKYRHYAPEGQVILIDSIAELPAVERSEKRGVIASEEFFAEVSLQSDVQKISLGSRDNLADISGQVYHALYLADYYQLEVIFVERFRREGLGQAIMDKFDKASQEK